MLNSNNTNENSIKTARSALKRIADENGLDIETVRREIALAISAAQKNDDPEAKSFWASIPFKNGTPTPEELIVHIARMESRG